MKTNKIKKKTSVRRFLFKISVAALIGAILGACFGIFPPDSGSTPELISREISTSIQPFIFPGLILITILSIGSQEFYFSKLKKICTEMEDAEDELFDLLDFKEEKGGAILLGINIFSQGICIILFAFGYSFDYLKNFFALNTCIIFLLCTCYNGAMQARYIKLIQKFHPEKNGDVSYLHFREQWLESCDEAEKEMIYRSAYKSYSNTTKCVALLLLVTMIAHLLFHTGIFAIVAVAFIYLFQSLTYYISCVRVKKSRLQNF